MKYKVRLIGLLTSIGAAAIGCTGNIDSSSISSALSNSGQPDPTNKSKGSESTSGPSIDFGSETSGTPNSDGADPTQINDSNGGSQTGAPSTDGTPSAPSTQGVTVQLTKLHGGGSAISFGMPLARGVLTAARDVQVLAGGSPISAKVRELLKHYDVNGNAVGVAAIQVQLPTSIMAGQTLSLEVRFRGGNSDSSGMVPYSAASVSAPAQVQTTSRGIGSSAGVFELTESSTGSKTLFMGREPNVVAAFPDGYLASTNVLGRQVTAAQIAQSGSAGTKFLSDNFKGFALSSIYADGYAYNPDPTSVVDFDADYEAWLYDRCATYLSAFSHFGDARFAQFGFKSCAYFTDRIGLDGTSRGIFTGKPTPDTKYSHVRGLYAYYALTGDEAALAAATAIADLWNNDATFVIPYRQGHIRGVDKLWTERLLSASLEGLLYGYRFTGDKQYFTAVTDMVNTAYKHITGDAATLQQINPGANFPPQNCFIHSGLQQSEATSSDPWCSPWMSELLVDSLLQYQLLTNDARVDEIFIRLARFLRDVGTAYFTTDPHDDRFLSPSVCDDASAGTERRRLVPLYGAALNASGQRVNKGEWSDFEHCADATALSAAALRALKRTSQFDAHPTGPFKSEGDSILQLHHELLSCAERTFAEETRPSRDPSTWTSKQLAAGAADPSSFILDNKIGFPSHMLQPSRKLSWWFNTSMQQFKMLDEVGIHIDALHPGLVQPPGCK